MGKRDIRLMIEDVKFGCRSVGVIKKNNKILFQKNTLLKNTLVNNNDSDNNNIHDENNTNNDNNNDNNDDNHLSLGNSESIALTNNSVPCENDNNDDKIDNPILVKKRVRWDCKTCINNGDKGISDSLCSLCEKAFEQNSKTNTYYKRRLETPECCGKCPNIMYSEDLGKHVCTLQYYDKDKKAIVNNLVVRNNYLNKNRPSFCKL